MLVDKEHNELPDSHFNVDQLNESDAELLHLLAAEDDCSDILQNIASSEQFENLINNDGTDFTQITPVGDECTRLNTTSELEKCTNKKKQMFKCNDCEKIFFARKKLRKHLVSHSAVRAFSCNICYKTFKQKYEVTAHKRSHEKPSFQCDICSKMFIHKSHLTCHRRKHIEDCVEYCKECNKSFISNRAYKHHIDVCHNKSFCMCDICGAKLSTISALNEHKTTHLPEYGTERKHVCEACGKTYLSARNLRDHMKVHEQPNRYVIYPIGTVWRGRLNASVSAQGYFGTKPMNTTKSRYSFTFIRILNINNNNFFCVYFSNIGTALGIIFSIYKYRACIYTYIKKKSYIFTMVLLQYM